MGERNSQDEKDFVKQKISTLFSQDLGTAAKVLVYLDGRDNDQHSDHWRSLIRAAKSGPDELLVFYVNELANVIRMSQERLKGTSFQEFDNQSGTNLYALEGAQHGSEYSKEMAHPFLPVVGSQERSVLESVSFIAAGKESTPKGSLFQIAVIGQQQVGKSTLIHQLQRLYQSPPQSKTGESGSSSTSVKLNTNLTVSELPALGLASDASATALLGRRKTFYEANNVEKYDLIILLVGNRFREDDEAIIRSASTGKQKQPMLIAKVISNDPSKLFPQRELDAIEKSLMDISAFLNRACYSNASVFAVNLLTDFSSATFQLNEQQFLDRIQMYYDQFLKAGELR